MELLHKDITVKIIKSFYNVYNELGFGFLSAEIHSLRENFLQMIWKNLDPFKSVFDSSQLYQK